MSGRGGFHGLGRTQVDLPGELRDVEEHAAHLVAGTEPLPPEEVPLPDALDRVLAWDLAADAPLPRFPNAAMDGYAVRVADLDGATAETPVRLPVAGEVAAGPGAIGELPAGAVLRIMTGAPVPAGAEAVVPVELTVEDDGGARFLVPAHHGDHIRGAGEDVAPGATVLTAGTPLGPAALALVAALGRPSVHCHRRPRVSVLSTGDEIVAVGTPLQPGQLHDANGPMLRALVTRSGGQVQHQTAATAVADRPEALAEAVREAAERSDLVLLTGGVSAGAHDHLASVLAELGQARAVRLAMKPGKPQVVGWVDGVRVLGLPGNPVSARVSFELFVVPVLRALSGRRDAWPRLLRVRLGAALRGSAGKRTYVRVRLDGGEAAAAPSGTQGSHVLSSLLTADGLVEVPPDRAALEAGETVTMRLWSGP